MVAVGVLTEGGFPTMTTTAARRRCACGAILRTTNTDSMCSPCDLARHDRYLERIRAKWSKDDAGARGEVILATIGRLGSASIPVLATATGVDEMTTRDDLKALMATRRVERGPKVTGIRHFQLGQAER